jgi:hypothetical protein
VPRAELGAAPIGEQRLAGPLPPPGADDQQVAGLAGHAGQDLAGLAAQHGRLDPDPGGQAAEGGVECLPQPVPGVVLP